MKNIAKICHSKHVWSEDTTESILEEAVKQNRVQAAIFNSRVSYPCIDDKNVCIEDYCETTATQTDPLFLWNFVTKDNLIEFVAET